MKESYKSNNERSARLGGLEAFMSLFIGFILGGAGGYVISYFAAQPHALVYPASGWELGVMVGSCLTAIFGMILAILGAGIATSISKPWWMGALTGGFILVIGLSLFLFLGESNVPYSDHQGTEGKVNFIECNAHGWATDPDNRDRDLKIRILVDDDPVPVATTVANLQEQYIRLCTKGTCGFIVNLGGIISVDETHKITVQAYDNETEMWENLENTPKTLSCSGYPDGYHGGNEGNVNSSSCYAFGWVVDPDDRDRELEIRIFVDSNPEPVARIVPDILLDDERCAGKKCGFNVNLSGLISASKVHKITVQAYDLETEKWVNLRNTPRYLACSGEPAGYHDGNQGIVDVSNCSAFGWAADPNDPDRDIKIRVLVDNDPDPMKTTIADLLRKDVNVCTENTCGFNINLWGLISPDETHQITVQAFDIETESWANLDNTPKALKCSNLPEGFRDGNEGN